MTGSPDGVADIARRLRTAQDRDLAGEGIPMVLALVDETVDETDAADRSQAHPATERLDEESDGGRLAATLDAHRQALVPTRRDGDLGVVATLLTLTAFEDFGHRR